MANNTKEKDIFAPPSKEELKDFNSKPVDNTFAPPTADELQKSAGASSTMSDALTGLQSGAQLGFTDELKGAGTALGDVAGDYLFGLPKKDVAGYLQTYRDAQQKAQGEQDQAAKNSPYAYGAGQLVGGLIPGIAASPLAAASPIATGAGAGALSGLGNSKGTLDSAQGAAQVGLDTTVGGIAGAALGRFLPGGAKNGASAAPIENSAVNDLSQSGEFIPQLKTAFKMGQEGLTASSKPTARKALTDTLQSSEQGIADVFGNARQTLGKEIESTLDNAVANNVKLNISPEDVQSLGDIKQVLTKNQAGIGRDQANKLFMQASQMQQGMLDPKEAYLFRKELGNITSKIANPEDQQVLNTAGSQIKNVLEESIPEFQGKLQDFASFAKAGPESLLSKGFDPDVADVFFGNLKNGDMKVLSKVRDLVKNMRMGGAKSIDKQGELYNTINQLEQLNQSNPELLSKLGIDPKKLQNQFLQAADESAVAQKTVGVGLGDAAKMTDLTKVPGNVALKAANLAGEAHTSMKNFFSAGAPEMAPRIQQLKQMGDETVSSLADSLEQAVSNNDVNKKNAILFALMQRPKVRSLWGATAEDKGEQQ